MEKCFDYFQVNGTLLTSRGALLGTSGVTLPTGPQYVVCTLEQFVQIIAYEPDGLNGGRHRASYTDASNPTWYGKSINRFNIGRFLLDYCEGKVARTKGMHPVKAEEKVALVKLAHELIEKYDSSRLSKHTEDSKEQPLKGRAKRKEARAKKKNK